MGTFIGVIIVLFVRVVLSGLFLLLGSGFGSRVFLVSVTFSVVGIKTFVLIMF